MALALHGELCKVQRLTFSILYFSMASCAVSIDICCMSSDYVVRRRSACSLGNVVVSLSPQRNEVMGAYVPYPPTLSELRHVSPRAIEGRKL